LAIHMHFNLSLILYSRFIKFCVKFFYSFSQAMKIAQNNVS
jgi:hypothetical protein